MTSPRRARLVVGSAGLMAAACWLTAIPVAHADEGAATCRRLRAEARSEAALLYSPRLIAGVVRLPPGGDLDPADTVIGDGVQLRGAVALSPVDLLRGRRVTRAADAECRRVVAADRLEDVLRHGTQFGRAEALRAEIGFLTGALPRVAEILGEAEARLARQIITAGDLDELRHRHRDLRHRLVDARHELALLEEQALDGGGEAAGPTATTTGVTIATDLADYERASQTATNERSALRRLSPWQLDVRVGVVPDDQVHWFGAVELTYRPGDLVQRGAERRVRAARADELRAADSELRVRADRFTRAMQQSAANLGEELALLDEELAVIDGELARLRGLDGDRAYQRRLLAEIDGVALGARRSHVARLLAARAPLAAPASQDGGPR